MGGSEKQRLEILNGGSKSSQSKSEQREEMAAVKKALVELAERRTLGPVDRQNQQTLRRKLLSLRKSLGEVLSPSEERLCLPPQASNPPVADPGSVLNQLDQGGSSNIAFRTDLRPS